MAVKFLNTSVGRKIAMALSAMFLMIFLILHFVINLISVFNAEMFNEASEFMGTNPLIQYAMQPVLFFGVVFHFVMGFALEIRNRNSRGNDKYVVSKPQANSSIFSRTMIYSGGTILLFLILHIIQFFIPSITAHHITHEELDSYEMITGVFANPVYTAVYVIAFIFLMFHLIHGFGSSFQSMGWKNPKYAALVRNAGKVYSLVIPIGFIIIAVYHYISSITN